MLMMYFLAGPIVQAPDETDLNSVSSRARFVTGTVPHICGKLPKNANDTLYINLPLNRDDAIVIQLHHPRQEVRDHIQIL